MFAKSPFAVLYHSRQERSVLKVAGLRWWLNHRTSHRAWGGRWEGIFCLLGSCWVLVLSKYFQGMIFICILFLQQLQLPLCSASAELRCCSELFKYATAKVTRPYFASGNCPEQDIHCTIPLHGKAKLSGSVKTWLWKVVQCLHVPRCYQAMHTGLEL